MAAWWPKARPGLSRNKPGPRAWKTPSSSSPVPPFATKAQTRQTRCASSPKCGREADDECDLHSLVARAQTLYTFTRADCGLAGPTDAVPSRARLRPQPGLQARRLLRLPAVRRAGCHRHVGAVLVHLF